MGYGSGCLRREYFCQSECGLEQGDPWGSGGDFADDRGTGYGVYQGVCMGSGDCGEQAACGLRIVQQGFDRGVGTCDAANGGRAV